MTDPTLPDPLDDLLDVLDLRNEGTTTLSVAPPGGGGEALAASEVDVFVGRSQPQPHGRVFGGQVLAQSLVAAGRTVGPVVGDAVEGGDVEDGSAGERPVHSMHAYFLRPGDANAPIRFLVERMRDGRSFSSRRVHAVQDGRILLSMTASFQERAGGLDHHIAAEDLPGPEELRSDRDILARVDHPVARHSARSRAVDIRHVEPLLLATSTPGPATQSVWMRVERELPDDQLLHAAILAYASDYVLLEPVLRRHGIGWGDPRLRPASLDHAMWFHRPARADDWFLYTQSSPSAQAGRGLGTGHMFASDGTLLATVAQEGMIRIKE